MIRALNTALVTAALTLAGCGSVSSGGPDAALDDAGSKDVSSADAPVDGFVLTTSGSVDVEQGKSAMLTVAIERGASFDDAVNVSVEGLPPGVSAQAIVIASGSSSGMLTVAASMDAAQGGPTTFTVQGTGGTAESSADVQLMVRGAPGTLDTSFGTAGSAPTTFVAQAIILQPDGKAVMTGQRNSDVAVHRFTVDGANDEGFGTAGQVLFPVMSNTDEGSALALQGDGKIVVAGNAGYPSNVRDTMIARLGPEGALDPDFATGGKLTVDIGGGGNTGAFDSAQGVVVLPDGKIVSAGTMQREIAFLRTDAGGTLDSTFGSGGKSVITIGDDYRTEDVALQPDGKLLVAGEVRGAASDTVALVLRILPTGSLDPDFGTGGKLLVPAFQGVGRARAFSILLLADGKILVGGTSGSPAASFVIRLTASGALDPAFGNAGVALFPAEEGIWAMHEEADGKIFVVGVRREASGGFGAFVRRLTATGALDPSFGTNGTTLLPLQRFTLVAAFTSDGRALVTSGQIAFAPDPLFRIWR